MSKTKLWYIPLEMGAWTQDVDQLTLEAEGALLRITFKLWNAKEKGRFIFAFDSLSRMLKKSEDQTRKIIQELHENDILDIEFLENDRVKIESRRMLKEAEISAIRAAAGKLGGRPRKPIKNKKKPKIKENSDYDSSSNSYSESNSSSLDLGGAGGENGQVVALKGEEEKNEFARAVIRAIAEITGRKFMDNTKTYISGINARRKENKEMTVDDAILMAQYKYAEWVGTEYEQHVNPETLFRPKKFPKYYATMLYYRDKGISPQQAASRAKNKERRSVFGQANEMLG